MEKARITGIDLLRMIASGTQPKNILSDGGVPYTWNADIGTYIHGSKRDGYTSIWAIELANEMFTYEVRR